MGHADRAFHTQLLKVYASMRRGLRAVFTRSRGPSVIGADGLFCDENLPLVSATHFRSALEAS